MKTALFTPPSCSPGKKTVQNRERGENRSSFFLFPSACLSAEAPGKAAVLAASPACFSKTAVAGAGLANCIFSVFPLPINAFFSAAPPVSCRGRAGSSAASSVFSAGCQDSRHTDIFFTSPFSLPSRFLACRTGLLHPMSAVPKGCEKTLPLLRGAGLWDSVVRYSARLFSYCL